MTEAPTYPLYDEIIARLRTVIDPETNADVIRMQLVKDLNVQEGGQVSYTFEPSSYLCPLAVFLVTQIKKVISGISGVTSQMITVESYIAQDELTKLINQEE